MMVVAFGCKAEPSQGDCALPRVTEVVEKNGEKVVDNC